MGRRNPRFKRKNRLDTIFMEELINFIIVTIFITVAVAIKLVEMASRKKMSLPLPEIPPEEVFPEEAEIKPEPKVIIRRPPKIQEKKAEKPAIPISIFTRDELKMGIILSTILGPPRSLSRFPHRG